jgi:hypothetical protein
LKNLFKCHLIKKELIEKLKIEIKKLVYHTFEDVFNLLMYVDETDINIHYEKSIHIMRILTGLYSI